MGAAVHVQVFLELKLFAAFGVLADPLLVVGVGLLVALQRALLHKLFSTVATLERALTRVRANVASETSEI